VATTGSADVDNAGYAVVRAGGVTPALADVSETMLWELHNRATEAKRRDGVLVDFPVITPLAARGLIGCMCPLHTQSAICRWSGSEWPPPRK
jgi:hypothetical protein